MMFELVNAHKIVTYVPQTHIENFADKAAECLPRWSGSGDLYDKGCWWASAPVHEAGTEQYRVLSGSRPAHGIEDETCRVASVRIEFLLKGDQVALERFISEGIIANHPWQMPVIEVHTVQLVYHRI